MSLPSVLVPLRTHTAEVQPHTSPLGQVRPSHGYGANARGGQVNDDHERCRMDAHIPRSPAHPHHPHPLALPPSYRMSAPNIPETAKVARDMVAAVLAVSGHPELADTARLLVSELVTNVQKHTAVPELMLRATVDGDRALVSVIDTDPRAVPLAAPLALAESSHPAEHGRGLPLVAELASDWGTTWLGGPQSMPTSKSVWFELHDDKDPA